MTRARVHPIETLTEWAASLLLGGAAAWVVDQILPSQPNFVAIAAGAVLTVIALATLRKVDAGRLGRAFDLTLEPLPETEEQAEDDILLLEDELGEPLPDSRVVRLFAGDPERPLPAPGELAARIDQFLGDASGVARIGGPAPRSGQVDASAELHRALADIRRSLG